MRLRTKIFLRTFIPAFGVMATLLCTVGFYSVESYRAKITTNAQHVLDVQREQISQLFQQSIRNTLLLSSIANSLLSTYGHDSEEKLADILMRFSRTNPQYSQARILDKNGHEIIRIQRDSVEGRPKFITPEELQDKSHRTYFSTTVKAPTNTVYVSRLNLNRENTQIEIPHNPVIRFAAPIDAGTERFGVIILNYNANIITSQMRKVSASIVGDIRIANSNGYWLLHEDPSQEWGEDIEKRSEFSMHKTHPDIWNTIRRNQNGQIKKDGVLYTFEKLSFGIGSALPGETMRGEDLWLLCRIDERHLLPQWFSLLSILSGLLVLGLLIALWQRAKAIEQKTESEQRIRETEAKLIRIGDAVLDSLTMIDSEGKITFWNKAAETMFGYSALEALGHDVHELLASPKDYEQAKLKMKHYSRTGLGDRIGDTVSLTAYHKNGTALDVELSLSTLEYKGLRHVIGTMRDVTERNATETRIRISEKRLSDIIAVVGEFVWELDADGIITHISSDAYDFTGYTPKEFVGKRIREFVPAEDQTDFRDNFYDKMTRTSMVKNYEHRLLTKSGETIWVQTSGKRFRGDDGILGYRGAAIDITDRKRQELLIRENEQKLSALAESAYDAIIMINSKAKVMFWNRAAEQLFGYSRAETMGRDVHDLISPDQLREHAKTGMREFSKTGQGAVVGNVMEFDAIRKDGSLVPVERSVTSFLLHGEWCAVGTIRDITERRATEEKLKEMATTDPLTGLYNRRRFLELAEASMLAAKRYDRPISMVMLDIDHFKKVNDTHGHDVGDIVLKELAKTSLSVLRDADVLGRLGGEEFALLLPETGQKGAWDLAERLRKTIENLIIPFEGGELGITISLGTATWNAENNTVAQMLKAADDALYKAKRTGRNKVVQAE